MKLIFTILILSISLKSGAQDTLYWIGSNRQYTIQQSPDSYLWKNYATTPGAVDSNYIYPIPKSSYYYRILAGSDTSNCILTTDVVAIIPDSIYHPQPKNDATTVRQAGSQIIVHTKDFANVLIYDVTERLIEKAQGIENIYMNAPSVKGVYIIKIVTQNKNTIKEILNQ